MKKVVYIASAYSGSIENNVELTRAYSRFAVSEGAFPLNPILNLHGVLDETDSRETALAIDLELLHRCDELWVFGTPTKGMKREIAEAEKLKMPVKYFS